MDWDALRDAARRSLRPGRPLQEPLKLLRVAIGMLVATIVGYLLHDNEARLLVSVGAFLATIAAVMPHERSRIVASTVTCVAQVVAAALGAALSGNWAVVLPTVFILFLASGLLRAVGISISMRWAVITIVFLAFAEISSTLAIDTGRATALFALGFAIMALAQLLPPYEPRHSTQGQSVAGLYRAIAAGESTDSALLKAERSLALLKRRSHPELDRLAQLVAQGEEIGQLVRALRNRSDAASARWLAVACEQVLVIASAVVLPRTGGTMAPVSWPGEPGPGLELALSHAVDRSIRLAAGGVVAPPTEERRAPSSMELVKAELHWGSPILHHAARLAVVCVIAELVGLAVGRWLGPEAYLAGHGFWVVVAAALIAFPDYGSTFSRGIGRTVGTIAGAAFGVALSFRPESAALHSAVLLLLFCGYLAFRSCGQPFTMFWVVAWIGSLTPGPVGALTRGLDTILGCLLAFAAFLVAPTWQRRLLTERLQEWAGAAARQIEALVLLWTAADEGRRLTVAHSVLRTRVTGLEFHAAAGSARDEPRDRRGRWPNDTIAPAVEAVRNTRTQLAVLSALAPLWSITERTAVCSQLEQTARVLDTVASGSASIVERGDAVRADPSVFSPDTATALDRLGEASAVVQHIAAEQSPSTPERGCVPTS